VFTESKTTKRILKEFSLFPDEVELISCDAKKNCIFKVTPIIDTALPEANELVVASDTEDQALKFEIRPSTPSPSPSQPITVTMKVVADARHHIHQESFTLNPGDDWTSKWIGLPATKNTVNPFQVKISVTNAPGVLLRNVSACRSTGELASAEASLPIVTKAPAIN
jgi:hypothetical protein